MKKLIPSLLAAALVPAFAFAAPADDVKAAAKKLADAANYSWSTTTANAGGQAAGGGGGGGRGGFGGGPSSGVAEKGGLIITTRQGQNGPMQTVRKGEVTVLQNQQGEWVTTQELMAQFGGAGAGAGAGGQRGGGGRGFGGPAAPADDIATLVAATKELKSVDGAISGDLAEEAVALRLNPFGGRTGAGGGQAPAAPKNAMGSVKFWLKDGALVKYEVHVKGTVQGRNGERERDTTTTTEIKDVGTTKVEVPEAAKKKLG